MTLSPPLVEYSDNFLDLIFNHSIVTTPMPHLVVWAVQAAGQLPLQVDLGGGLLQEVRNPLDQEVSVLQVSKQEGHTILGADGERAGQHVGAVRLLNNCHLEERI